MIGAPSQIDRAADARRLPPTILRPGRNCWRVDRADAFSCIQDAADYFRLLRQAMLRAQHTVFILGWDILASVDLQPDARDDSPTRLGDLIAFIANRRPRLRFYILVWDYSALYTLERDPLSRWRLGWKTPRNVRFGFDDRHPLGGSHHQKVVVIDDQLAFCGGADLTGHRWDTAEHRVDEPARKTPVGEAYEPYHEVQAMVSGPAASSLGVLARDRWRALGERRIARLRATAVDLWPPEIVPDLNDVDVAISRTVPAVEGGKPIRECEALFLDSIAAAKRTIYIENQYFTNDVLGQALARRLHEADGPEVIVVTPNDCHGWLEQNTMCAFRDAVVRQLIAADLHRRLRIVHPAASQSRNVATFVHSKVMIVDEELARIGSANFSRRSMGVDTECDLAVEAAGDARVQGGIRTIRNRLVGEHLGLSAAAVAAAIARTGSLGVLIDERAGEDRALVRVPVPPCRDTALPDVLRVAADPDEPILSWGATSDLVPPIDDATPVRRWRIPMLVMMGGVFLLVLSSSWVRRPEFYALQTALASFPENPSMLWAGATAFLAANVVLVPLEFLAIAAGLLFGGTIGPGLSFVGSLAAASVGYVVGRVLGPARLAPWLTRRAYRSVRQLGAQGVMGVLLLRLASVASARSVHLLCGAGRVPFTTYIRGTLFGLAPAALALAGLGALLRHTVLYPTASNALMTLVSALLVIGLAAGLRTLVLVWRIAPALSTQRRRAEFG